MEGRTDDDLAMIDPDEIPAVPANNFLMRRTSPVGDYNRRWVQKFFFFNF